MKIRTRTLMKNLLSGLALSLLVGSCSSVKAGKKADMIGGALFSSREDQQLAFVKHQESYLRVCAETDNDFATAHSTGIGLGFKGTNLNESGNTGEVVLGGRSPAVLITRELMYRACEMVLNLNLNAEQATDLYLKTLESIHDIASANTSIGTQALISGINSNTDALQPSDGSDDTSDVDEDSYQDDDDE